MGSFFLPASLAFIVSFHPRFPLEPNLFLEGICSQESAISWGSLSSSGLDLLMSYCVVRLKIRPNYYRIGVLWGEGSSI